MLYILEFHNDRNTSILLHSPHLLFQVSSAVPADKNSGTPFSALLTVKRSQNKPTTRQKSLSEDFQLSTSPKGRKQIQHNIQHNLPLTLTSDSHGVSPVFDVVRHRITPAEEEEPLIGADQAYSGQSAYVGVEDLQDKFFRIEHTEGEGDTNKGEGGGSKLDYLFDDHK